MTVILAIESSCDETGVGIARLESGTVTLLADEVASSVDEHARFGGVVPEIARARIWKHSARRCVARWTPPASRRPDVVAATIGPGLAGALLVGVAAAKAYAAAWGAPFYAVNHLGGPPCRRRLRARPIARERRAAGVRRAHASAARAPPASRSSNWAARSTMPPVRRTTRWRGCWGSVARVVGCSTSWPALRPRRRRVPARHDRPARRSLRVQLLRPEDRRSPAMSRPTPMPPSPTWRPASRRRWPMCSPARRFGRRPTSACRHC